MKSTTAILAALLAASTTALPVDPNRQSCTAISLLSVVNYSVLVGEPFVNGNGCGFIKKSFEDAFASDQDFGNFFCLPGDNAGATTRLSFQADHNQGAKVNGVLGRAYPAVNGFNCPDF